MRKKTRPGLVKLIVGLISGNTGLFQKAQAALSRKFGLLDFESGLFKFDHTDYYEKEFGSCLYRQFLSFKKLIDPAGAYKIKLFTNRLERKLAKSARQRDINIDPGYIALGSLILFTTKNYSHRIYLDKGIYAETTLSYRSGTFQPLEWTYPDFRSSQYIDFFNSVRDSYKKAI